MHTDLADKLGITNGETIVVINAPHTYQALLPKHIRITTAFKRSAFIHVFVTKKAHLALYLPQILQSLEKKGMVWISWPKKSSTMASDLSDSEVRDLILPTGLVDIKVVAIDETWSGLKFVWRKH